MTTATNQPTDGKDTAAPPSAPQGVRVAIVCSLDLCLRNMLYAQIRALQQAGYEVLAICADGPHVESMRADGLDVETAPLLRRIAPIKSLQAVRQLVKLFKNRRIDIVHTHTPMAAYVAQIAAKRAGVPIRVNTLHGLYYLAKPPGLRRRLFKKLEIATCRRSTHVLSQSAEDVDMLLETKALPADKVEWLGNGVDLSRFCRASFDPKEGLRLRREFDIPADAFVVGIVARMVREKGFAELFEAFKRFRASVPNAHLLHVGFVDRSRGDEITPEFIADHGVEEHCRFVGQRDDVARLMTAMDIYCLPSYREGYPRSVIEANAMGVPAIVTDVRGSREAVVEGVNGLLVPVRDAASLASAMKRLHDDADLRERLAAQARERAEELFDERRVCSTVLACYEKLLRRIGLRQPSG